MTLDTIRNIIAIILIIYGSVITIGSGGAKLELEWHEIIIECSVGIAVILVGSILYKDE